jgi:hypothetical protein
LVTVSGADGRPALGCKGAATFDLLIAFIPVRNAPAGLRVLQPTMEAIMAHRIDYRHEFDEHAAGRALWAAGVGFVLLLLVLAMTAGSTRVASLEYPPLPQPPITLPIVPVL